MARLTLPSKDQALETVQGLYEDLERRTAVSQPGLCPVSMARAFLALCKAQSCGKCVPCHVGLDVLEGLLDEVVEGRATEATLELIERTSEDIQLTSDCAIGVEAARMVLEGLRGFRDDYLSHIHDNRCLAHLELPVPCVALCPAHVDIPGYIACIEDGRPDDAVRQIRRDNPFPSVCAYICEHPCEDRCRRGSIDAPVGIRTLKRYAVDHAGYVAPPEKAPATGKKVAIVGGGPGGMTCAYYLALMGHSVKVFEQRDKLGGMLRYGIPDYRLPQKVLDDEMAVIESLGVEVEYGVAVGKDVQIEDLQKDYDAVFVSIGAHLDRSLGADGEDLDGVISAVELLRDCGELKRTDFTGKSVAVIGGGNVAMDCARTAVRLGAREVNIVYRRRIDDMTALPEEIAGAQAEGCEVMELMAPVGFVGEDGKLTGVVVQPQVIGPFKWGRPAPRNADAPQEIVPADIALIAIGQAIESDPFARAGYPTSRDRIVADEATYIEAAGNVFAGGDCVTGPATVIKAIAGGKVAAANIDEYLGYHHPIGTDVRIPEPKPTNMAPCGRVEPKERPAEERKHDFELMELCMSDEEAAQECGRCLRCDHYGYGIFRRGRVEEW